jgi:hypothetical protein
MAEDLLILRKWTGVIRTADEAAYVGYIEGTGVADYAATPGNAAFRCCYANWATAAAKSRR